jgi:hypothetical protein
MTDDADDNLDALPPPVECCVLLRSKTMYFDSAERPGRLRLSDEQTYWCTRTQSPEGPDEIEATPKACQSHRPCFRAEE